MSGVQFKKGPYYADEGDFSAAGAANVNYVNTLDRPLAILSGGRDGWGRVVAEERRQGVPVDGGLSRERLARKTRPTA